MECANFIFALIETLDRLKYKGLYRVSRNSLEYFLGLFFRWDKHILQYLQGSKVHIFRIVSICVFTITCIAKTPFTIQTWHFVHMLFEAAHSSKKNFWKSPHVLIWTFTIFCDKWHKNLWLNEWYGLWTNNLMHTSLWVRIYHIYSNQLENKQSIIILSDKPR